MVATLVEIDETPQSLGRRAFCSGRVHGSYSSLCSPPTDSFGAKCWQFASRSDAGECGHRPVYSRPRSQFEKCKRRMVRHPKALQWGRKTTLSCRWDSRGFRKGDAITRAISKKELLFVLAIPEGLVAVIVIVQYARYLEPLHQGALHRAEELSDDVLARKTLAQIAGVEIHARSRTTSNGKSFPTCPTPGSTTPRPRSVMKRSRA